MNGMAQLVGHRAHIPGPVLVVQEHPGGELGVHRQAKRAAALARADLAVDMPFLEEPPRQAGHLRVKGSKRIQDHLSRLGVLVGLFGLSNGRVDIVPAQGVQPQPAGLKPEVALEERRVLLADIQQGVDRPHPECR